MEKKKVKLSKSYDYTKKLKEKIENLKNENDRRAAKTDNYIKELKEKIENLEKKNEVQLERIQIEQLKNEELRVKLKEQIESSKKVTIQKETYIRKLKSENEILKNSKFYKIQSSYWKIKNKLKRFIKKIFFKLKEKAKQSQFLCELVWKYRAAKTKNIKSADVPKELDTIVENESCHLNAEQSRELFERSTDKKYIETIRSLLEDIPESNGGRYYEPHPYKIGIISDEFLFDSFKDAANFEFITPDNWENVVEETDMLLMVSTWRGLNDEWRGVAQENHPKRELIYQIIEAYQKKNKKTIFYSKEDPPNYNSFIGIAQKCDYIFTTCEEVVDRYKIDCANDNVAVVCFGINPLYHNPIGICNSAKKEGVIFSGSWMKKYPERLKDMHMLFHGVLSKKIPLKIIDRNYNREDGKNYRYPKEYWKYVSPAIEHDLLQKVHKLYNWAINVNSVTASKTMYANRCYELQAAGNLLLSNYSIGVNERLPMVHLIVNEFEVGQIMNQSSEEVYHQQIQSIRSVMSNETSFDRVGQILETIGLETKNRSRMILVVANKITERVKMMFDQQTYANKKLIALKNFTQTELETSDMITFFHSDMDYDVFYLEDMSNGFKYTDSDYITKDAYYSGTKLVGGVEHNYINRVKNKYCTLFWSEKYSAEQLINFPQAFVMEHGYSIDHFNYNAVYSPILKKEEFDVTVVIPIYNNGKHLLGKAFASLQRSSIFENMEIILVECSSDDGYSDKYSMYLEHQYKNVKLFSMASDELFINKNIKESKTSYIMFLRPETEAINDGIVALYSVAIKENLDIVVGNNHVCTAKGEEVGHFCADFVYKYGTDFATGDLLQRAIKEDFIPISVECLLIKKQILSANTLKEILLSNLLEKKTCETVVKCASSIKVSELEIVLQYA